MEEPNDDQVDSTLPPEWTLPELPKVITPSLSTAEFEEIFGGSDEENNFPLSVGGLQGHLELDNVLPNPNELFGAANIAESLNLEASKVLAKKTEVETSKTEKPTAKETTLSEKSTDIPKPVTDGEKSSEDCTKVSDEEHTSQTVDTKIDNVQLPEDGNNMIVEVMETEQVDNISGSVIGRRSARIKAREDSLLIGEEVTVKSEGSEFDEESLVDSLLEKNNEVFQHKDSSDEPSQSSDIDAKPQLSDEDSDDEDSDDPDKLWCICQQPHNDRFMICCDSCGEWYHGECVGISVTEGKKMEKTGQEYVCTKCVEHENEIKVEREKNRSMRLAKREQMREKQIAELRDRRSSETQDTLIDPPNDDLFLPDNLSDKEKAVLKNKKKKLRIRDLVKKPCLGPGCEKLAVRPCLYCSEECIERHCEFSLKKLSVRGLMPSKGQGVTLYEPSTKKMLTGLSAPEEKTLLQFLKEHKSFKVFVPSQKVLSAAKKPIKKFRKESDKDDQVPDSSTNKPILDSTAIRGHAKKALKQVLMARCRGTTTDLEKSDNDMTELANDIELKLYNLHNQDVTQKYRSKCRSLLFNLKDTKNQVLFRKLVTGDLTTRQLVRMTPDQLASEELAEWREKTIKKELDMIKEVAIEEAQMSSSGIIRKMTYKGEVEIERQSEIETATGDKPDEVTSTTPELPATAVKSDAATPQTTPTIKPKLEVKPTNDSKVSSLLTDILTNTTSQHGSHVFDQNCDICLGKKTNKPSPVVHFVTKPLVTPDSDLPSPDSRTMDTELITTEVTSPNPINTFSDPLSCPPSPNYPIWTGTVSMHGLETTSVIAYPVSGPVEKINIQDTFPDSLLVVGRIAHQQVWDYIDKLKSSLTKEVVVLRLDRIEDDRNTYLDFMDYFLQKHRYGVVQCTSISGIKDIYLVPLQYDDPPPPQLFPFDGPGLPFSRKDTFLCIVTRVKSHQPVASDTPRKRTFSGRVRFSADTPPLEIPRKKPRTQVIVGFGDQTPPCGNEQEQLVSPQIHEEVQADVKHRPFFYRETEINETIVKEEPMDDTAGNCTPTVPDYNITGNRRTPTVPDYNTTGNRTPTVPDYNTTGNRTPTVPDYNTTGNRTPTVPDYNITGNCRTPTVPDYNTTGNRTPTVPDYNTTGNRTPTVPDYDTTGNRTPTVPDYNTTGNRTPTVPDYDITGNRTPTVPDYNITGNCTPTVPDYNITGNRTPTVPDYNITGNHTPTIPDSGIKSILSSLSDEKIKELASVAMSAFGPTKDVKTAIAMPSESTSLMTGTIPQYSISTAQLNTKDDKSNISRDPRSHNLSLDERLKATFGNKSAKPTETAFGNRIEPTAAPNNQYTGYPHSRSLHPQSDSKQYDNTNTANTLPSQQRHSSHPSSVTQKDSHFQQQDTHEYNTPNSYQTYYSPQASDRGYNNSPSYHPPPRGRQGPPPGQPYPFDRYSDYRPPGGGGGFTGGTMETYDYDCGRGNDQYRRRGGGRGRGFGERRRNDGYSDRGGNWGNHDNYRERDNRSRRDERDRRSDNYDRQ